MGQVYGVGLNDFNDKTTKDGKHIYEYELWKGMLKRCYSDTYHKQYPTYKECEVEPFLLSFTNFYNFVRSLKGFGEVDEKGKPFQMDKDLLVKGNKTYGVDTICFIPNEINSFLTSRRNFRGTLPLGVNYVCSSKKFIAHISFDGKIKHLGSFESCSEAFAAYKKAKETHAKKLGEKWKGRIDDRAYYALMKYEVSSED
ncbi:hypothetical protein ACT414_18575 (plasmid) [Acinetobacter baumannii]